METSTLVPLLRLEAASGTTLYPDENGFSAVWGEVEADDPTVMQTLDRKAATGASVTVRCGTLEVVGTLREPKMSNGRRCYKLSVESVRYGTHSE